MLHDKDQIWAEPTRHKGGLKFNPNWWMALSTRTKKSRRGRSKRKPNKSQKKKLQNPSPHHLRKTKWSRNQGKKLQKPPPHHQRQTKWYGNQKK
jgi:hypothetical protein